MKILALDCATVTGWSFFEDRRLVESGTMSFAKKRGESNGILFLRFRRWLMEIARNTQCEIIAYERAHFRGGAATEIGVGLQTRAQEVAAELKIETFPVTTTQVKKRATGKGNASKDEVMAEAQKIIGRWPQTDDEADAVFIGLVAVEELEVEADCGKEPDFS